MSGTEPVRKRKKLEIYKYLDVSTSHVMESDLAELKRRDCPIVAYPYPEGVWVHVTPDKVTAAGLQALGFSEGFAKVYVAAQKADCYFIRFDCDGMEYEQFPVYEW
jgi:hypothetical protein